MTGAPGDAGSGWLAEAVGHYRAAGFFADQHELSVAELAEDLDQEHYDQWGEPLPPPDAPPVLREILVMEKDRVRSLWADLEADVGAGNDAYVTFLAQLAEISLGSFRPEQLKERWRGNPSRPKVSFVFGRLGRALHPEVHDDWLDISALSSVNSLLGEQRRRFYTLSPGDQTVLIVALTDQERSLIESTRGVQLTGW